MANTAITVTVTPGHVGYSVNGAHHVPTADAADALAVRIGDLALVPMRDTYRAAIKLMDAADALPGSTITLT